jgi:hypothetical protein
MQTELLFTQFARLYDSYEEFTHIVRQYVESDECSKVELQILVDYIKNLDECGIMANMDLLGILIEGFLIRIEIREIDKSKDFYNLFKDLPLTDPLLIKLSIFDSIKTSCYSVLR